jgi:hypothetical protein
VVNEIAPVAFLCALLRLRGMGRGGIGTVRAVCSSKTQEWWWPTLEWGSTYLGV